MRQHGALLWVALGDKAGGGLPCFWLLQLRSWRLPCPTVRQAASGQPAWDANCLRDASRDPACHQRCHLTLRILSALPALSASSAPPLAGCSRAATLLERETGALPAPLPGPGREVPGREAAAARGAGSGARGAAAEGGSPGRAAESEACAALQSAP